MWIGLIAGLTAAAVLMGLRLRWQNRQLTAQAPVLPPVRQAAP
jgi:MATE family multidrug resistance protein